MAKLFDKSGTRLNSKHVNMFGDGGERQGSFNLQGYMARGSVPDDLLGLNIPPHGSSAFSQVAHRQEQMRRLDNLINNSVTTQLKFQVMDENGVVTTPFPMNGNIYRPDKDGYVRIADQGRIDLAKKIRNHRRERTKKIVNMCRDGDDVCAYIFGYTETEWKKICQMKGPGLRKMYPGMVIDDKLADMDCSIEYIESLPPLSITQTQSIAKLTKICEYLADTVNIEGLTTTEDEMSNMKDGHNTLKDISKDAKGFMKEVTQEMKDKAAARVADNSTKMTEAMAAT